MLRRLADYVRESPILSGGLTVYVVVVALAIIFALGVMAGVIRQRGTAFDGPVATSAGPAEVSSEAVSSTSSATATGAASRNAASAAASRTAGDASGSNTVTPAKTVSEDVERAGQKPLEGGVSPTTEAWLVSNFGAAAAPERLAGLTRSQIQTTEATVTAVYVPGAKSPLDSVRLVVHRLPERSKPKVATEQLLDGFGQARVAYDWGGRKVTQGLTAEDRPEQFPPAVCMVWVRDGFGVQVTVIPRGPGLVADARTSGLALVSALPY